MSLCLSLQVPSAANSGSIEAPVKAVSDWQNYIDDTGNVIEGEDDILLVHDVVWSCDLSYDIVTKWVSKFDIILHF